MNNCVETLLYCSKDLSFCSMILRKIGKLVTPVGASRSPGRSIRWRRVARIGPCRDQRRLVELVAVGSARGNVGLLQYRQRLQVDRFLQRRSGPLRQRQQRDIGIEQQILLDRQDRPQRIGNRGILPVIGRIDEKLPVSEAYAPALILQLARLDEALRHLAQQRLGHLAARACLRLA